MEETQKKPQRKPKNIEDMTKEQIQQAIIKKRECNAKALQIVESLLENSINEEYLLKCLQHINQSHFEDVIEERSILHLCGYPLCQKALPQNEIPKQKYRISIKTNKVYDITARKSFCSNCCYKSAIHIKKQMLTSPLWFREYEEIPTFYLLPRDTKGSLGQEVDLGIPKIDLQSENHFTSINDFANASLNEFNYGNDSMKKSKQKNDTTQSSNVQQISYNETHECPRDIETNEKCITKNYNKLSKTHTVSEKELSKKNIPNPLNIVGEVIERPEKKIDPILLNPPCSEATSNTPATSKKTPEIKQKIITTLIIEVEKCLAEWFTTDTLLYLFGESKVKEMVADKGDCIKEYLNNYSQSFLYNSYLYDQYQALCKKLNMLELEDKQYDSKTLKKETKPLPSYTALKEESKKMQLKVKAFFSGETEIPEVDSTEVLEPNDEEAAPNLPLVDKNAQNALRRRIVCQHLNKVLPDLLRSLGLLTLTISSDVRILVNTFKLKANNIMFKPIQWTLIALIFIKLLSLRDARLKHLLDQSTAFNHMQLLLLSYQQDGGYLDRLIAWLTDIDRLLDANDTQLTVG